MLKHRNSLALMAALAIAGAASVPATGQQGVPNPRRKSVFKPALTPSDEPDKRTQLQREIAEWNAAVDRRNAMKRRGRGR